MPCYHPVPALFPETLYGKDNYYGKESNNLRPNKQLIFKGASRDHYDIEIPCGRCSGCRLERTRQWSVRITHEAKLWKENCFITLTFNPENLPKDGSINYKRDFQPFIKDLREYFRYNYKKTGIRFYMCGEYGENFNRPHYHACLFNLDFPDKKLWKIENGNPLYTSKILEKIWGKGFVTIGALTQESAAYVARYVMKKITGDLSGSWYESDLPNEDHGAFEKTPEFAKMSLKPGIGADYAKKYFKDIYPHDFVIIDGKETKPPKYYDDLYKKYYPDEWEIIQQARLENARLHTHDNNDERLAVKEKVTQARLKLLKRIYE